MAWKNDECLEEELRRLYCYKGLNREEVLSYMKRDFISPIAIFWNKED